MEREGERLTQAKKDVETMKQQIKQILDEKNDASLFEVSKNAPALPKLQIKPRRVLKGHLGKLYSVHWSEDKIHLVSASQDGKMIVWDAMTTNKVHAITLKSNWVLTCAFAPSSTFVASGGLDNTCSIYNLRQNTAKPAKELNGHSGYVSCCRFLSDRQILTSSGDGTCGLWDIDRAEKTTSFEDHDKDVMCVALSPADKNTFVSGGVDTVAKLWDIRTGKCVQSFYGHESDVNSVAYFPGGNAFVTGSDDRTCRLFDIRGARELALFAHDDVMCGVTGVALSASGRLLFVGYETAHCQVWDVLRGERVLMLQHSPTEPRIACMAITADGSALCTGSWDTTLKIWA